MICAWKELLSILPPWIATEVDRQGRDTLQELHLRLETAPQLLLRDKSIWLSRKVSANDLNFCVNIASRYSPWTAQTAAYGYITAAGGHRIGICGSAVMQGNHMTGIRTVRSLCIRVARDFPGIAQPYAYYSGSILIIGPPGSGKTTLLRDLIRQFSERETVAVVDERCELFPADTFVQGCAIDILSGCPKHIGIEKLLRTMGPETIAIDEITAEEDCAALLQAGWCGVRLIATAHAANISDLRSRPIYRSLVSHKLFEHVIIVGRDKSIHAERMIS